MEAKQAGKKLWYIPDCFYPPVTTEGHYVSHEAICILNTTKTDADISLTLYFEDKDPMHGFVDKCEACRTKHIRLDKIRTSSGIGIPKGVPYAILLESSIPVIAQYSRLDTTQSNMSLMTCVPY